MIMNTFGHQLQMSMEIMGGYFAGIEMLAEQAYIFMVKILTTMQDLAKLSARY